MAALFSKLLAKSDVEKYLCISSSSLGQQLQFEEGLTMNMNVRDCSGQKWIFACTTRLDEHLGIFISVDWLEFAREKDVRVGDQVIIYEEIIKHKDSMETQLKIEVQRKIRLFGVDIWANVQ